MRRHRVLAAVGIVLSLRSGAYAKDDPAPQISFLEGAAGQAEFLDESVEPYFKVLQPIEMVAKTGGAPLAAKDLAGRRDECRERYRAAVKPFTPEEKAALTGLAAKIGPAWATEYPLFARTPWSFLKVDDAIEGGLPHTRAKSIVLSVGVLGQISGAWAANPKAASSAFIPLLVHEQSHVVQRFHPEVFAPLYTGSWGFVRAKDLASDAWLDRQHLGNPDGIDVGWAYALKEGKNTTHIQPLVIFSEGPEPRGMPEDFQMVAVTLEKKGASLKPKEDAAGKPVVRPLLEVAAFASLWGGMDEIMHPNEIFASLFAQMVAHDHFGGPGLPKPSDLLGADFAKFRSWCRQGFAVKEPVGTK